MCSSNLKELVRLFNERKMDGCSHEELNLIAEQIQERNMLSYDIKTPFVSRRKRITDSELRKWDRLSKYVEPGKSIKLFDSAFGSGRDIIIASELGYDVYGCELSEYLYSDFVKEFKADCSKIVNSDLRSIPFEDKTFDVIRHNASFLHMPLIAAGFTVHKCLEESFRLLRNDGLLYIYTKEGEGFSVIDTLDGLGDRAFQFYGEELLGKVLDECGFDVINYNHYNRERNGNCILWIEAFARKKQLT